MHADDTELLAAYRRGQVVALEELVEKYRRPLFGFIIKMMGRSDEADDVFQEVWFRVIRKLGTYKQKNFLGWLIRIAHNIVIDRARKRKPDVSLDRETDGGRSMVEVVAGQERDPGRQMEARDLGLRINQAMALLPINQREVFVMRTQSGLSFKDIAGIQKVSINTALARMQYALEKLRGWLKDEYQAPANNAR